MAKVNFLNQGESFMSENSQLSGNANKKTRKWRYLKGKSQKRTEQDWSKIFSKEVENE